MGSVERGAGGGAAAREVARGHRFPKAVRLRKRREFLAVQAAGKRFQGRYFLAVVTPGLPSEQNAGHGRVGITVTKKIGNAVTRNRIKRMVRDYVRRSRWLEVPMQAVIIARRGTAELHHQNQVDRDLARILRSIESGTSRRRGPRRGRSPC